MAQPTDRESFIVYCRQKLGEPVIPIELSDGQADNCVDDALQIWREYHFDATERTYLQHQVTQDDIDNQFIPCSDDIITVIRVIKTTSARINLFDVRYQLRLQDFYSFSNVSMQHYEITQEKMALLDWMLNPDPTIRFERYTNKIHVNLDWKNNVAVGDYLVFEVYKAVSETDAPRIWQDKWLKAYAAALMKRQWGSNLKKFSNIQTLGGVVVNGQQIFDEAMIEIEKLEEQLYNNYQAPPRIFLG